MCKLVPLSALTPSSSTCWTCALFHFNSSIPLPKICIYNFFLLSSPLALTPPFTELSLSLSTPWLYVIVTGIEFTHTYPVHDMLTVFWEILSSPVSVHAVWMELTLHPHQQHIAWIWPILFHFMAAVVD